MSRNASLTVVLAVVVLGCTGPKGREVSAGEYRDMERDELADSLAAPTSGAIETTVTSRRMELEQAWSDEQAALGGLADVRARLVLQHAMAQSESALQLKQARASEARARDDLEHFDAVERERRLREHALVVQEAADAVASLEAELAQLQQLYAGATADAAAEIVLARTRRALELAQARHAIAEDRHEELATRILPRERRDLEAVLERSALLVTNAERSVELGQLERRAALADLEQEERAIRARIDALTDEQEALTDPRGWDG